MRSKIIILYHVCANAAVCARHDLKASGYDFFLLCLVSVHGSLNDSFSLVCVEFQICSCVVRVEGNCFH